MKSKHQRSDGAVAPRRHVELRSQVLSQIRRHARADMDHEICGVLVGALGEERTVVHACIEGEAARQGGTHVTFTQDTWTHIYETKDRDFPDSRIVGWYHSHPGFGIFLSEHDTFIHQNFFSHPGQIAWVYDPKKEEEGCFVWKGQELVRLESFELRDDPSTAVVEIQEPAPVSSNEHVPGLPVAPAPESRRTIGSWAFLVLSHLLLLVAGIIVGATLFPVVLIVPDGRPVRQHENAIRGGYSAAEPGRASGDAREQRPR